MKQSAKIIIPESIGEITLKQFQEIAELVNKEGATEYDIKAEKIRIVLGISHKDISQNDFEELSTLIDKALNTPEDFKPRFKMKGVEFGMHPNLNDMGTDEYKDLMFYNDTPETLHFLMAILFRPIKNKDGFGNYTIEDYNGTDKYRELMKEVPLSVANGAVFFFRNLSQELLRSIQKYSSQKELKKGKTQQIFGLSGNGMAPLSNSQTTTL